MYCWMPGEYANTRICSTEIANNGLKDLQLQHFMYLIIMPNGHPTCLIVASRINDIIGMSGIFAQT